MSDDRLYKAHSASKIWLSPEARAWARHWGLSEREFGKFLLAQHLERGDAFAGDVAEHAPGRDERTGFEPQALINAELRNAFENEVAQDGRRGHSNSPFPFE
jgi:hypothetical protein